MKWNSGIGAALAALLLAACAVQGIEQPAETPLVYSVTDAGDSHPVSVPSSFESDRGWLVVPEDRSVPDGRLIRLPYVIIKARSGESNLSPVIYLAGGPGTSGMSPAFYPGAYPWTADRDFVILAPRGTEFAEPALLCTDYMAARGTPDAFVDAATSCRASLTEQGVDLDQYHSDALAADIETLRQALGYDQWTLFGVSYGTRLALTIARNYPDTVRAMVLDSPLPPNAIYDDESARNFESALRAVAQDCAAQENCALAFPALEERFFGTLDDTMRSPISYQPSSDAAAVEIDGGDLATVIDLSSSAAVRYAPLYMDAVARLDEDALAAAAQDGGPGNFAWGMRLSVWCSESLPFSRRAKTPKAEAGFVGLDSAAIPPEVCEAWAVARRPARVVEPVSSEVPTLIIAGEFDPLTPPRWGDLAAETLPNSAVITARGGGHIETLQWDADGCPLKLAAAFIADPEGVLAALPGTFCLSDRPAPDYVTTRSE